MPKYVCGGKDERVTVTVTQTISSGTLTQRASNAASFPCHDGIMIRTWQWYDTNFFITGDTVRWTVAGATVDDKVWYGDNSRFSVDMGCLEWVQNAVKLYLCSYRAIIITVNRDIPRVYSITSISPYHKTFLANDSTAFRWKLLSDWLNALEQRDITLTWRPCVATLISEYSEAICNVL